MKVYLDVFFLVNCMMNYLILTLLGMIRRRRLSIRRQAVAAATGSLASVFFFLAGLGRFNSFLIVFYGFVSGILITIAFGRQQARDYIVDILLYYVLSFFISGILVSLSGPYGESSIALWEILAVVIVLLTAAKFLVPDLWRSYRRKRNKYKVCIGYRENEVTGTGFLDTGDLLIEPVSRRPVVIVEFSFIQPLLKRDEEMFLKNYPMDEIPESHMMVHYIPFSSIGNPKGYLLGIKADWLKIQMDGKWQVVEEPWLGICENPLSSKRDYEMLLHEGFFPSAI